MTAEDLLAGPRGRRMCLEWAQRCEDEQALDGGDRSDAGLRGAVWDWSFSEDRPGRSVMFALAVEDAEGMTTAQVQEELARARREWRRPTRPDPARVAALMEAVPVRAPNEGEALILLRGAVDNARYWQPPDPEDDVAGLGEMRDALRRVAEVLAAAPSSRWWASPMDRSGQWAQTYADSETALRWIGHEAAGVLADWRQRMTDGEREALDRHHREPHRTSGGEWWSAPPHSLADSTRSLPDGSPLGLWCVEDSMGPDHLLAQRIRIPADLRILEIDGSSAWAELCRQFPLDVTWSRRGDWGQCTGRTSGPWVVPDWAALAESGLDAVHLTVRGYLACAGAVLDVDGSRASTVAGWDPDRTFWLHEVEPVGPPVTWESDPSGSDLSWRRVPAL